MSAHQPLAGLLEARAREIPRRVAVVFRGESVTYQELHDRAGAVAGRLRQAGVARNSLVGLHLTRSVTMIAAMLGIHKAGGAYVPLDPAYPRDRLDYIVGDARLEHVLYDGALNLGARPRHCIDIGLEGEVGGQAPVEPPVPVGDAHDLAYVIYTSGSTGRPKGVKVPQSAVVNFLRSMQAEPGMRGDDVLLAVTTPSFDISVLEIFLPLLVGATLVLASNEEVVDGRKLAGLIRRHDVSIMQATPATWRMLFMTGWTGSPVLMALCGGEVLDNTLAAKLVAATRSLWNMYGPTETTVWSTCGRVADPAVPLSVGRPIFNTTVHVLDDALRPVPGGEPGELYIGGAGVALGYTDEALTASRFLGDPFSAEPGARLYRTGDMGNYNSDGTLSVIGRTDDQVKVKGFRVELNEVRNHLLEYSGVAQAAVIARKDPLGETRLVAFLVPQAGAAIDRPGIRDWLAARLPAHMMPSVFVALTSLPLTPNGKVDRNALLRFDVGEIDRLDPGRVSFGSHTELLAHLLGTLVHAGRVDLDDNIFALGIDSLQANFIAATFGELAGVRVSVAELFQHPTINSFVAHLDNRRSARELVETVAARVATRQRGGQAGADTVAIIGMAGRFPGAGTVEELWTLLAAGRDTVTRFSREQDDPAVDDETAADPHYVRARGMIESPALFDAAFFGISPNDAAVMDPQQRVFLEIAWEAFENAGYDADRFDGLIGVYAGMGNNFYYYYNVATRPRLIKMVGEVQAEIGREKDHIATLVSHKLNLTGPSLSVHTACSTGLVAIDSACHSLLSGQCDLALAGAIEIRTPQMSGQLHEPGGIFTADGRCRPFADNASGTMFSDGAGAVVLKRLSDALRDSDHILAVIRGSAVNHDGLHKKSYLAPSVRGQMDVIATAHARAGVRPGSITYVEAHGTATPVGDPIEFHALKNVFELDGDRKNYCAIGSVKANLGHPTTAAGVVGVIKTVLALQHHQIPPLVNFERINPNIDIADSPFFINTTLLEWPAAGGPRRAGVSSFGFCGTNAHVVLEEAPTRPAKPAGTPRPFEVLLLSAATETALQRLTATLAAAKAPGGVSPSVADVAYTLAVGRKRLKHRRSIVCRSGESASKSPAGTAPPPGPRKASGRRPPPVGFLFPGQGSQYVGMGRGLYAVEPAFRGALDRCLDELDRPLADHVREVTFESPREMRSRVERDERLTDTAVTQPAIFCLEYALASLWLHWGVTPHRLLGHSVGEFVCGALAGVFSVGDALRLVAARGRLMAGLPRGAMLSVRLPHAILASDLPPRLSIAAVNSANLCVVSGPAEDVDAFKAALDGKGIRCQRLHTSHAFHSWMMEPAVPPFLVIVRSIVLAAPKVPIISTVTGRELTAEQAQDPKYWANHLRVTVQFARAVETLWEHDDCVVLEIGPRGTLSSLAVPQVRHPGRQVAIPTLGDSWEDDLEPYSTARAVGHLWEHHVELDWPAYFAGRPGRRVPLPTYPFERKRYWAEPAYRRTAGEGPPARPDHDEEPSAATTAQPADRPGAGTATGSRGALIEQLKAILESVLGEPLGDASTAATFVELGFDSLLLAPIAYLIKERFGAAITFRQLLRELTTIDMVAEYLSGTSAGGPDSAASPAIDAPPAEGRPGPATPTAVQPDVLQRFATGDPAALACLESARIDLAGELDRDVLRRSIGMLVERHTSLRTRFTKDGERVSTDPGDVAIEWVDARQRSLAEIEEQDMRRPFALTEGPLIRFTVVKVNDARHVLLMTADSAICDGWSADVLIEELARMYSGVKAGEPVSLPQAHQLHDFERDRETLASGAAGRRQEAYWLRRFADRPPLTRLEVDVPTDDGFEAPHAAPHAPAGLMSSLRAVCARSACSVFTALLATLCLVVRRHGGRGDIIVAVPMAEQSAANMPRLVGPCTRLVPIRARVGEEGSFRDLLRALQDALIEAHENRHYSLDALPPASTPRPATLCPIGFAHTKRLKPEAYAFRGLVADYRFNPRRQQVFELLFNAIEFDEHLQLECSFKTGLYRPATVRRLLDEFCAIITGVVHDPDGSILHHGPEAEGARTLADGA